MSNERLNRFAIDRINKLQHIDNNIERAEFLVGVGNGEEKVRFEHINDDTKALEVTRLAINPRFIFGMHIARRGVIKDLEPFRVQEEGIVPHD